MFAVSLRNKIPTNIYTEKIFCRTFDYEGDDKKLKEWYENTILEFNDYWKNHIIKEYLAE